MRKCTSYSPSHLVWESDSDEKDDDNSLLDPNEGSDAGTAETIASVESPAPFEQGREGSGRERTAKAGDDSDCSADLCGDSDAETAESAASVKSMLGPPGNWGPRAPHYVHAAAIGGEVRVNADKAELKAFQPQDITPQFQAGANGGAVPSIGSAWHDDGHCRPCAFFNQGVCSEGASCGFCHLKHKRNYHGQSQKKRERFARLIEKKKAVQPLAGVGTIGDGQDVFQYFQW